MERVNCVATGVHGLDNTGSARYIELRLLVHYGVGGRGICVSSSSLSASLSLSLSVCHLVQYPLGAAKRRRRIKTSSQLTNNPKQFGWPDRICAEGPLSRVHTGKLGTGENAVYICESRWRYLRLGDVMARLHHDGNEIKDLFIFKIKFLYIYMYMYINNTILACNRYLPKRKKKKRRIDRFPARSVCSRSVGLLDTRWSISRNKAERGRGSWWVEARTYFCAGWLRRR